MLTDDREDKVRCNPLPAWLSSDVGVFGLVSAELMPPVCFQLPVGPEQLDISITIAGTIKKNDFFMIPAFFLSGLWPRAWV
jgi:hypothetical protein